MSVFDHSFNNSSSCFGICNERGIRIANDAPDQQDLQQANSLTGMDRQKKQEIDKLLAEAMNALTFEERQEQQEILHGVEASIAEEATFIEASLKDLESHLASTKSGSVYEMAEAMDYGYVSARAFRVMFLRGNQYDAKAAADQMLKFFTIKQELFGSEKLVKDITLDDLNEGDMACLKSGRLEIAGEDRSGRQILLNIPGLRDLKTTLQNGLRSRYYFTMSMLESEANQIRGIIAILYTVGSMKDRFGGSAYYQNARVAAAIPTRLIALHVCSDDMKEHLCHNCVIKAAPLKLRANCRLHFGSNTECLYRLSTYGIPRSFLPIELSTNQINLHRHLKWVESRFEMGKSDHGVSSEIAIPNERIVYPTENDVLIIGGNKSNNTGNIRLRALVKDLSKSYEFGSVESRKALVNRAIHLVHDSGGRFLKQRESDMWRCLSKSEIRKIIAQAFRNSYRRK
ncbi:unnamed protein product [Cylindrotheca closterium]|uniref:DUF6824 domain-containing protein n=1 Tax=Cylindrotheca closterium TaxID=2856 RepID=A0AAD2CLQ3_9STRA|nr:unnamed protein product [Cylindrotheca closterium]